VRECEHSSQVLVTNTLTHEQPQPQPHTNTTTHSHTHTHTQNTFTHIHTQTDTRTNTQPALCPLSVLHGSHTLLHPQTHTHTRTNTHTHAHKNAGCPTVPPPGHPPCHFSVLHESHTLLHPQKHTHMRTKMQAVLQSLPQIILLAISLSFMSPALSHTHNNTHTCALKCRLSYSPSPRLSSLPFLCPPWAPHTAKPSQISVTCRTGQSSLLWQWHHSMFWTNWHSLGCRYTYVCARVRMCA